MKIIFAGTPEFAAAALAALVETHHRVCAVYSQPDRPAGRGRKLTPSAVKRLAEIHGLPVFQPASLRPPIVQQQLRDHQADVMVVVAYGLILPQAVLAAPRLGCLNIHASLLPRWRGAAPIQRALLTGDTESGVTIIQMDAGLDTGDMLVKLPCPIEPNDTGQTLHDRLAMLGPQALMLALNQLEQGTAVREPQDDRLACYAPKVDKAEARIDWFRAAVDIERQVRAFNPWPIAHTTWNNQPLRVWGAALAPGAAREAPGTVVATQRAGIDVATGRGILRLQALQLPGKRVQRAADFLNAHHLKPGARLGALAVEPPLGAAPPTP